MALRPSCGVAPCALVPFTLTRHRATPLCAMMSASRVGSPTTHAPAGHSRSTSFQAPEKAYSSSAIAYDGVERVDGHVGDRHRVHVRVEHQPAARACAGDARVHDADDVLAPLEDRLPLAVYARATQDGFDVVGD